MKKLIIACSFLFTLTGAFANTCIDDPEDTVSRKISETLPEVIEGAKYPSAARTFSYVVDHIDSVEKATLIRGKNAKSNIAISILFNDGSDTQVQFNHHDLGARNLANIFNTVSSVTRSRQTKINLNNKQLKGIMNSKTVGALTAKTDYIDQDTEIGAKEDLERCTLTLEIRPAGTKVDAFTGGLF